VGPASEGNGCGDAWSLGAFDETLGEASLSELQDEAAPEAWVGGVDAGTPIAALLASASLESSTRFAVPEKRKETAVVPTRPVDGRYVSLGHPKAISSTELMNAVSAVDDALSPSADTAGSCRPHQEGSFMNAVLEGKEAEAPPLSDQANAKKSSTLDLENLERVASSTPDDPERPVNQHGLAEATPEESGADNLAVLSPVRYSDTAASGLSVEGMSVSQLRAALKARDLSSNGKRLQLQRRLRKAEGAVEAAVAAAGQAAPAVMSRMVEAEL